MSRTFRQTLTAMCFATILVGCSGKVPGLNPNEVASTGTKMDAALDAPREWEQNMSDNALLHDMSLADIHFVPHTTELSGTGAARLDRMALLLDTYGGTVHYETLMLDNEELVNARIEHAREYLSLVGCDMSKVNIKFGLAQGRGQRASLALETRAEAEAAEATTLADVAIGGS